ncbi:hypothetical protein DUI87_06604 [Hirundo rustica rustica]|uniref:Uncharacterized protein n=1 Tax=Hirundo rustica rustica TaxID=333673 RepID=A0A3M0KU48_HIRRU|nr:hypothetical protein DUI87_06604 [Hirundo rustica rustica]
MASSQGKNELLFADWMAALPGSLHSAPLTNLAIPAKGKRSKLAKSGENAEIFALPVHFHLWILGCQLKMISYCKMSTADCLWLSKLKFYTGKVERIERDGEGMYGSGYVTEHNQFWEEEKSNFVQPFAKTLQKNTCKVYIWKYQIMFGIRVRISVFPVTYREHLGVVVDVSGLCEARTFIPPLTYSKHAEEGCVSLQVFLQDL